MTRKKHEKKEVNSNIFAIKINIISINKTKGPKKDTFKVVYYNYNKKSHYF